MGDAGPAPRRRSPARDEPQRTSAPDRPSLGLGALGWHYDASDAPSGPLAQHHSGVASADPGGRRDRGVREPLLELPVARQYQQSVGVHARNGDDRAGHDRAHHLRRVRPVGGGRVRLRTGGDVDPLQRGCRPARGRHGHRAGDRGPDRPDQRSLRHAPARSLVPGDAGHDDDGSGPGAVHHERLPATHLAGRVADDGRHRRKLLHRHVLRYAKIGNWIQAAGGNPIAARARGVRVDATKTWLFILTAFLAAYAGITSSIRVSAANPNSGTGYELEVIAMVVIGGTALAGGRGTIIGTVLGVLMLRMMRNGIVMIGVPGLAYNIFVGVTILIMMALQSYIERRNPARGR